MDVPLKEYVNNKKKDFSNFKEDDLVIQDSEAKVLETKLEEDKTTCIYS